jgi:ABC-type polysaccharide transport system permease subunit
MLNEYRMQTYLTKFTSIAHIAPYFLSFVLCAAGVVAVFSHDAWLA